MLQNFHNSENIIQPFPKPFYILGGGAYVFKEISSLKFVAKLIFSQKIFYYVTYEGIVVAKFISPKGQTLFLEGGSWSFKKRYKKSETFWCEGDEINQATSDSGVRDDKIQLVST